MSVIQSKTWNKKNTRRGGVLVYVLLAIVMLMGMTAVAIDISMMYAARRRAQNVADAAALAGGRQLPLYDVAKATATKVVNSNNATGPAYIITSMNTKTGPTSTVTLDDGTLYTLGGGYALTVSGYVDAPMQFAQIVGYHPTSKTGKKNTLSVTASATIIVRNACGIPSGMGMAPFGVVGDDPNSTDPYVAYIATLLSTSLNTNTPLPNVYQPDSKMIPLKVGEWSSGTLSSAGNFGPLALNGSGASIYMDAIENPTGQSFNVGAEIITETGNMVGPSIQGIKDRLSPSNTAYTHRYADYKSWFFGEQQYAVDTTMPSVTDGANTYYYKQDPHRQELTDARVLTVPIIATPAKTGKSTATILGFSTFFIEQIVAKGTNLEIWGRFIGIMVPQTSSDQICSGGGLYQMPRIIR